MSEIAKRCAHTDTTTRCENGNLITDSMTPCFAPAAYIWEHQQRYASGYQEPLCAHHCAQRRAKVAAGQYVPPERISSIREPQEQT